jgi:serine/threonine-protein kinase HipA
MAKTLDVYFHRMRVGQLVQNDSGQIGFAYDKEWLGNKDATALSQSLPLRPDLFSYRECAGFFGGILPEEMQRDTLAKNLGISAKNDFALLEKIGGECAGAVTFLPEGMALPSEDFNYKPISEHELAEDLRKLPRRPLLAGEDGIRLSLAGAQNKIAVRITGDQISLPIEDAPSTHIIKPDPVHFPGIVPDEAMCLKLASTLGLPTAEATVHLAEDVHYLLVERYDRLITDTPGGTVIQRLHQEDFCQALGIPSQNKYQHEGGPSLKQCFELLRNVSSAPAIDLLILLDGVIFNFLIGNNDAHGKNFSLLYTGFGRSQQIRLAPFYDLISTIYFSDLNQKMAMKIGNEYDSQRVFPHDLDRFANEAGLTSRFVRARLQQLAETIKNMPDFYEHSEEQKIMEGIRLRCERTLKLFSS